MLETCAEMLVLETRLVWPVVFNETAVSASGASVFSVETVCIKATRCQVQLLGSEATYSENSMTGAWAERWLYHIR